ncbi:MAG: GNAT family N-acetyltransferase [Actinomycetota bacterium]|jgi:GNAT superfamily N-acetyltransferase|nr:GNAT family N-acetyltransferase [Actinomycetota bacterium]
MARRFRPLTLDRLGALQSPCASCVFWESPNPLEPVCGVACDDELIRDWFETVTTEWGECGRAAAEDDQVLGFIKYAPVRYFPQARHFPGVADNDAVLISCLHIRDDARRRGLGRVLMQTALRDLAYRGERKILAYCTAIPSDMRTMPVVGMEFLLRQGFTVHSPHPRFPLMQLDLRATLPWAENLEAVLESLRIPLRQPRGVPTTFSAPE